MKFFFVLPFQKLFAKRKLYCPILRTCVLSNQHGRVFLHFHSPIGHGEKLNEESMFSIIMETITISCYEITWLIFDICVYGSWNREKELKRIALYKKMNNYNVIVIFFHPSRISMFLNLAYLQNFQTIE